MSFNVEEFKTPSLMAFFVFEINFLNVAQNNSNNAPHLDRGVLSWSD
jgi:hypothetical protein